MTIEEIANQLEKKHLIRNDGKYRAARKLHCSVEEIKQACELLKQRNKQSKIPKILIFDVETAPMRAYVWGRWKQNIALNQTISEWFMLCWSAKWLYSEEIISDKLTGEEAKEEFDYRIVKNLWELINQADIVIAYNGKRADIPWMNTRFIQNNLTPPSPYLVIDPCEVAKKEFGFSSNKLDALAGYFDIPHKLETDFSLWDRAVKGDEEAIGYMSTYCNMDVKILEEVYIKMRPWIKGHPNIGNLLSSNSCVCSHCGSKNLELISDKFYFTSIGKYNLYRCKDCGGITRGRTNLHTKTVKVPMVPNYH